VSPPHLPDEGELRPSSHPTRPPSVSTSPPTRVGPDLAPHAVPTRAPRPGAEHALDVRSAFLLLHADGREDLASIGELTALTFEEVRRVFAALVADGLVTLSVPREVAPPASHASHTTTPPPL
jgi:hypothetical protein